MLCNHMHPNALNELQTINYIRLPQLLKPDVALLARNTRDTRVHQSPFLYLKE